MTILWKSHKSADCWFVGCAIAHGTGPDLLLDQAIRVQDGVVTEIVDASEAPAVDSASVSSGAVVDATGATAVPSFVDCHSHLTLQGGAQWLQRGLDETPRLLDVARSSANSLLQAGVGWIRDVGAPMRETAGHDSDVALNIVAARNGRGNRMGPRTLAAGTWLAGGNCPLPAGLAYQCLDADHLYRAVCRQLDDGADLIKLYLELGDDGELPFQREAVENAVQLAHDRGVLVSAHATKFAGTRLAAEAGVNTIEHGCQIDDETADMIVDRGIALVSTLSVYKSFTTFSDTTTIERFKDKAAQHARFVETCESLRRVHSRGGKIAAGSDFGGGSVRPGHLAWEADLLVEAGLTEWEALAAMTWRGGDAIGEATAGRLEVGGPATFNLVHGNPLNDIGALWRLWMVVTDRELAVA